MTPKPIIVSPTPEDIEVLLLPGSCTARCMVARSARGRLREPDPLPGRGLARLSVDVQVPSEPGLPDVEPGRHVPGHSCAQPSGEQARFPPILRHRQSLWQDSPLLLRRSLAGVQAPLPHPLLAR